MSLPKRHFAVPPRDGSRIAAAFTLIEFVVVVPVVGMVLAALVAATQRTAQQDNLAACLANLRTIGQASLTYAAEDPSEIIIPVPALEALPVAPGIFEWGGKAGAGSQVSSGQVASSIWGTASWRGPAHRPLNNYIYRAGFIDWNPIDGPPQPGPGYINYIRDTQLDVDIYRCPSDTGYAGGGFVYSGGRHSYYNERSFKENREGLDSAYDFYGTSYIANAYWQASGITSSDMLVSTSPYLTSLSSLPAPSHTIVYQEVPSRCAWLWGDWSDPSCSWTGRQSLCQGNFNTIPGWHGTNFGFTVTFADGHASMVTMQGCMRPPPNLGSSNYPSGLCGETPPFLCMRCVTIRGPGWQLDTLPAPPVPTPWYASRDSADFPVVPPHVQPEEQ